MIQPALSQRGPTCSTCPLAVGAHHPARSPRAAPRLSRMPIPPLVPLQRSSGLAARRARAGQGRGGRTAWAAAR